MPDLDIETAAANPLKASGDVGSAEAHKLPDLIAAEKHLAAKESLAGSNENGGPVSGWNRLRKGRVVPPGAY